MRLFVALRRWVLNCAEVGTIRNFFKSSNLAPPEGVDLQFLEVESGFILVNPVLCKSEACFLNFTSVGKIQNFTL